MMSPISSISSSESGVRYLAISLALAAALLGALCLLSVKVKWFSDLPDYAPLLAYQFGKLDRSAGFDTAFVGDSSLGNAIDTDTFDRLTGRRSVNLALVGLYGYAGSYNMIRRALDQEPGLRTVVIIQAADMMARTNDLRGYVLSTPRVLDPDLPEVLWWPVARAWARELLDWHTLKTAVRAPLLRLLSRPVKYIVIENDYVKQTLSRAPFGPILRAEDVVPGNLDFLQRIADLCRARGLTCVYAHGPLPAQLLDGSHGFFQSADQLIESTGLQLAAPEPVPLADDQIGDTQNHTASTYKAAITVTYAAMLRPFIEADRSEPQEQAARTVAQPKP
ncbi:hypothetical protein [Mesorhizobium sp. M0959]|uniref:hypothetical protein n=1 Tax=unclassified Mesorhizobium TaxID=325217 RepID=UPI00333886BB